MTPHPDVTPREELNDIRCALQDEGLTAAAKDTLTATKAVIDRPMTRSPLRKRRSARAAPRCARGRDSSRLGGCAGG